MEPKNKWSRIYARKNEVVSRNIAGETILVPIRGNLADMQKIFTLNKSGAFIWEHLDGKIQLSDILESLLEHFDTTKDEAENDILDFIDQITESGLATEKFLHYGL